MGSKFLLMCLFFGLVLTVHELGHFLAGKAFGARIKSFNIFASLGFHIFSTRDKWFVKLFPSMASRVEVKIGWLPLLAYVSFEPPKSPEDKDRSYLHNKAAWQRLIIFSAGVLMNLTCAISTDMYLRYNFLDQKNVAEVAWSSTRYVSRRTVRVAISVVDGIVDKVKTTKPQTTTHVEVEMPVPDQQAAHVLNQKGGYYKLASRFPDGLKIIDLALIFISINIVLAVCNLLPVPPLDGGQMLFAAYECITRRPPNENFHLGVLLTGAISLIGYTINVIVDEIVKDFNLF